MSALVTPGILRELEQERVLTLNPGERCRFCHCSEFAPCAIPLREDAHGDFFLARSECETTIVLPCSWFVPRVCNAPACIEKLLLESRVVIFDGHGQRRQSR